MAKTNLIPLLKPSLDEIINVVLKFPINDRRREQLWGLIIKDEDLTRQLLARLNGNATVPIH